MTKRVLVTSAGSIQGIVNPGEEWEVFPGDEERPAGAKWFDAPDDVTSDWYMVNGVLYSFISNVPPFRTVRQVRYGDIGKQLGMIWDDLNTHGTLSKDTSAWFAHVASIKAEIDKSGTTEADISATSTDIAVLNADVLDWPSVGFVSIDEDTDIASLEDKPPEYVLYNGIEGNVLKNCVRGAWHAQTNPARAHKAGNVVNLFKPMGGPDQPAWEKW